MKKTILLILAAVLALLAACGQNPPAVTGERTGAEGTTAPPAGEKPVVAGYSQGTFIQPWMCRNWTDEDWEAEFGYMQAIGMEYLILSGLVGEGKTGKINAEYPSELPGVKDGYTGTDLVDNVLRNAQKAGIKVFLGAYMNEKWWDFGWGWKEGADKADFTAYMENFAGMSNKVSQELYNGYKDKYPDAFYAWYWAPELWNTTVADKEFYLDTVSDGLNEMLSFYDSLSPGMAFMMSPFVSSAADLDYANHTAQWERLFARTDFREGDIFAPQDSVGTGSASERTLDKWMQSWKAAVETKPGLVFWVNNEDFDDGFVAATIDRFAMQMEITSKYAEGHITFAFGHYYSPVNTIDGFYRVYKDYIFSGELEKEPPTTPSNVRISPMDDPEKFLLEWDAGEDNYGIAKYEIYSAYGFGDPYKVIGAPRADGKKAGIPEMPLSCEVLVAGEYYVVAVDCAGNRSGESETVSTEH